jgi:hypothetical protein
MRAVLVLLVAACGARPVAQPPDGATPPPPPVDAAVALATVDAAPPPPTARVENEDLVVFLGGKEQRVSVRGLSSAQLSLVPLRTDGSEPAVLAAVQVHDGGGTVMAQLIGPRKVAWTGTLARSVPHFSTTVSHLWLLDVDGDGWHDVVEYPVLHDDTGGHAEETRVWRYDPSVEAHVRDDAFVRRAPRQHPQRSLGPLLARATGAPASQVELWGAGDLATQRLTPEPQGISIVSGSVQTGDRFAAIALVWKDRRALQAELFLVALRTWPTVEILGAAPLGPAGFPGAECALPGPAVRRDEAGILVTYSPEPSRWVEQRFAWDGTKLGGPVGAPLNARLCP